MLSQGLEYADGENFSIGHGHLGARAFRKGPLAQLAAHLRARSLDQALIAGADPGGSASLTARAAQLTAWRTRVQIADGLERVVRAALEPPRRWSAVSAAGPALANAAELIELAALLRRDTPLYARGIAILNQLLADGGGPVYRGAAESLACALRDARAAALDG
ncbi:MAG: hypothetical protein ABSG93_19565 [Solirubrobacteraceae bacterium]|jgi:hypothetical protein